MVHCAAGSHVDWDVAAVSYYSVGVMVGVEVGDEWCPVVVERYVVDYVLCCRAPLMFCSLCASSCGMVALMQTSAFDGTSIRNCVALSFYSCGCAGGGDTLPTPGVMWVGVRFLLMYAKVFVSGHTCAKMWLRSNTVVLCCESC